MKTSKILSFLGICFLFSIAVAFAVLYLADKKSQKYKNEIVVFISEKLRNIANGHSELDALGDFQSCPSKKENRVEIIFGDVPTAQVILNCNYSSGDVVVRANVGKKENIWEASHMSVTSSLFSTEIK